MKEIWVMCLDSESGDHHHSCAAWDHKPSKDEINRVKIKFDCGQIDLDDASDADFIIDGIPYKSFVYEKIKKIIV